MNTKPCMVSLTSLGYENESFDEFKHLICEEFQDRFSHLLSQLQSENDPGPLPEVPSRTDLR